MTGTDRARTASDDAGSDLDVAAVFERIEQIMLGGPRRYTPDQVAQAAGTPRVEAQRLWRALGFPTVDDDDVVFTDADVEALRLVEVLIDNGLADDELRTAMTRMMGQTFARLASWQGQLLLEIIAKRPDLLESEDRIAETVEQLTPVMERLQSLVWRRQLAAYLSRVASHAASEVTVPGVAPVAVGFADLSGFTALTRKATESELRELLDAFESATTDVVGSHGGRIIKTIGDEVLFVADDPVTGAEIALDLIETAARDERLPDLRVGLAAGPVVSRLGDVYGSTVNIASRLTSICRPGWILVDRVMAESLRHDPRYSLKPRRAESVRGYHHLRQWRLRRAGDARRSRGG
ncbi:MAG: Adenylate cyclase [Pseudonocardiales bacterium]|nr:Adenylate cyclase [Pseudonocardiales bacterium]